MRLTHGIIVVLILVVAAALLPIGGAGAAVLTKHRFQDTFAATAPDPGYWTVTKSGGPLVGTALDKLEVFIPPDSTGDPFWGGVESRPGFAVKADSYFDAQAVLYLLQWPQPANGIRAALTVTVHDRHGKPIIVLSAQRVSDPDLGEVAVISVNGKVYTQADDAPTVNLEIARNMLGFEVTCRLFSKSFLADDIRDKNGKPFQHYGKITWSLSAWGHDYKFAKKKARVGFDDFRMWSEKGFTVPKE